MTTPKNYGEKGQSRVRVWEKRPGSNLSMAIWREGRLTNQKSLKHRDWDRAEAQAYELIALLERKRLAGEPGEQDRMLLPQSERVLFGPLLDRYFRSAAFLKLKPRSRKQRETIMRNWEKFLTPAFDARMLDEETVESFQQARRGGEKGLGKAEGQESMYHDFSALRAVLRWAVRTKDVGGRKLMPSYPLEGVSVAHNTNPRQVVISHDEFIRMRRAARKQRPHYRVFLFLCEATGRRSASVIQLQWDDIDFAEETITWRAATDKEGTEGVMPLTRDMARYLKAWRRMNPEHIWVFQKTDGRRGYRGWGKTTEPRPWSRDNASKWSRWLFAAAGLDLPKGAGWHSFRRKWVTERKGLPRVDVKYAGGWKSDSAFARYEHSDPETTRSVLERPSHRLYRKETPTNAPKNRP
jgi:integrase